jgi:tripartite ATP-independent transporter DctM subunit
MMFLGMPVSFSMMFVGAAGIIVLKNVDSALQVVVSDVLSQFTSYTASVVPMFALMGYLAGCTGIGTGLFDLAHKFIGHRKGGLVIATQLACALFGAICGSMPATVATFGTVAYPEMKKYNYDDEISTASIASGAVLAVLIPPSLWLIIYGSMTENSIGRLFVAGIPGGVILLIAYILVIVIWCKKNPSIAPATRRYSWKERFSTITKGGLIEIIIVFLLSLGGLFAGWFTPTEAGAIGAAGMFLITFIEKKLDVPKFKKAMIDTIKLTAMVYMLLAGGTIFGKFFAISRFPAWLGNVVVDMDMPGWFVLIIIVIIYLILGALMDEMPLILLTIPIFYPIICGTYGYDPIWYGVIIVIVVGTGSIAPPVGLNVFILKGLIPSVPIGTMFRGIWPFVIANTAVCILLIVFPNMITFLPKLMYG